MSKECENKQLTMKWLPWAGGTASSVGPHIHRLALGMRRHRKIRNVYKTGQHSLHNKLSVDIKIWLLLSESRSSIH